MKSNITKTDRDLYCELLNEYPTFIDVKTFCEILSISSKTAYRMLKKGEIKSLKLSGVYRISKPALVDYILKNS